MRWGAVLVVCSFAVAACGSGLEQARPLIRASEALSPPPVPAVPPGPEPAPPPPPTTAPPPSAPPTTIQPPPTNARVVVSPKGIVLPVLGRDHEGWVVHTPCGNQATISQATPVDAVAVVLDPGHGGGESGAVGPNGLTEAVLNMAVTSYTKAALERTGVKTVLTRTGEYRMTLSQRAEIVTDLRPKAFVSIHHNSEPDGPWPKPGTETYYQITSASSKRLAGLIYEEVVKTLSAYPGPWVADRDAGAKYRPNDRGGDYYAVLRQTAGVTSALAELAFISDPPEADLLARPDVEQAEGEAVARGIVRYLTTRDPGSGYSVPYPRTEPAGGGGGPENCHDPAL